MRFRRYAREPFRRRSFVSAVALKTIAGHGFDGYIEAMDLLLCQKAKARE
ncbi:MAG: type II 3-dehydroquinate dehydratase [Clostridia bacterium]|nr:type II 3-dehydroquinate dehydratase [Clostridia bacterium]